MEQGFVPLDPRAAYAFLLFPIAEAWPYELSVIRSLPIHPRVYVGKVVLRYLAACGVVALLIMAFSVHLNEPWTARKSSVLVAAVGYGFLLRLAMWLIISRKQYFDSLFWVIPPMVWVFIFEGGREAEFERALTLNFLAITSPIALALGIWGLSRAFRDPSQVTQIRSIFLPYFSRWDYHDAELNSKRQLKERFGNRDQRYH